MNARRIKKPNLCHAIVTAKGEHDLEVANGTIEIVDHKKIYQSPLSQFVS